jgi:predicted ATP-grasp superfamily ATP-dependent carboligase
MNVHVPSTFAPPTVARVSRGAAGGGLIVGGTHGSLAVARSLGRHGIPVWLITDDLAIARFSRHVQRTIQWPGAGHPGAIDHLLELARHHGLENWVLYAAGDADARLIAQHHAALSAVFRLAVPPWDTLKWAYDKRLMNDHAKLVGVDTPWTVFPRDEHAVAALDCAFPLILKPTVHATRNAFTQAKAWKIDDRAALLQRYSEAATLVGANGVMLQELIRGSGVAQFSYAAVWDRGRPVASLVARRTRQYPIDFGYTSTYVETISQSEIEQAALRFLRPLNYHGLVEIEFKYDARDQRYKILDVNGRIWTWIALGAAAGVDFPSIMWRIAADEIVLPCNARTGVAWMHASRDIVAACQEMRHGLLSFGDYITSLRKRTTFAAFANDDALPGVIDMPLVGWRLLQRRLAAAFRSQAGRQKA